MGPPARVLAQLVDVQADAITLRNADLPEIGLHMHDSRVDIEACVPPLAPDRLDCELEAIADQAVAEA